MQRTRARVGALLTTSLRSPLQRRLGCVPTNTDSLQEENQETPEEGSSMGKPGVLKTKIGLMYDENGSDCDDKTRKRLIKNRKSAKRARERKEAKIKSLKLKVARIESLEKENQDLERQNQDLERQNQELREHIQRMAAEVENMRTLQANSWLTP